MFEWWVRGRVKFSFEVGELVGWLVGWLVGGVGVLQIYCRARRRGGINRTEITNLVASIETAVKNMRNTTVN